MIQQLTATLASELADTERAKKLEELCQQRGHQIQQLQEAATQAEEEMASLRERAEELVRKLRRAKEAAEAVKAEQQSTSELLAAAGLKAKGNWQQLAQLEKKLLELEEESTGGLEHEETASCTSD